MIGKKLKVVENGLTFGGKGRYVNVLSLIRYKKNNSLYVLYVDVLNPCDIINFGSSHIKNQSILSMKPKEEELEIIKEYVFKVTSNEDLSNFEVIPLDDILEIEIIGFDHMEVKTDVLNYLVKKFILVSSDSSAVETVDVKKKSSGIKKVMIFTLFLLFLACGAYLYFSFAVPKENIDKFISCSLSDVDRTIHASVLETSVFRFDSNDDLQGVETTIVYQFDSKDYYDKFINQGTMYQYMPKDGKGGFKNDDDSLSFTTFSNEDVGVDYDKPTDYEEVFSYYRGEGYQCEDKLAE